MRDAEPIELTDGQTLLVVVRDGRVAEYTWDMGLPHVEFVKRRFGELPAGAWVGTVSKIDGEVVAISSKYLLRLPDACSQPGYSCGAGFIQVSCETLMGSLNHGAALDAGRKLRCVSSATGPARVSVGSVMTPVS